VISKFGENEFKSGDNERGRTYFESVLENAARRVDVWSVYLDMEIKYGDEDRAKYACLSLQPLASQNSKCKRGRRLFERATSLQLSSKKMKFLFVSLKRAFAFGCDDPPTNQCAQKKHLEYAKSKDDAQAVAAVKAKARLFVSKAI